MLLLYSKTYKQGQTRIFMEIYELENIARDSMNNGFEAERPPFAAICYGLAWAAYSQIEDIKGANRANELILGLVEGPSMDISRFLVAVHGSGQRMLDREMKTFLLINGSKPIIEADEELARAAGLI